MKIKTRKIADLIRAEYNPRELTKDQHDKLKDSLKRFGLVDPIIVNTHPERKDILVGGHQRMKVWEELGNETIPTVEVNLTLDKEKELNVRLNKNTGQFDMDMLQEHFNTDELIEWGFDADELNFFEDTEVIKAEEDDYEMPNEIKTDIVPGDLFEIGEHRLLCGDSTDIDCILKLLGDNKKFSIYTDPPYGINEKGDRSERGGLTQGNKLQDFKDDSIQYAVDAYNITREFKPLKEVWWGANYYCHHLPQQNNWLVWDKRVEEKQSDTQSDCELAWVADGHSSVRIFRHLWKGMMKDSERGQRRVHPTQKPIELASHCFNSYDMSNTILDLFGGSGATMVAAEQTKRKCLMMEFEPHYCQVIVDRMMKLDSNLVVKRNGKKYQKKELENA